MAITHILVQAQGTGAAPADPLEGWTLVAKHTDGTTPVEETGTIDPNAASSVMDDSRWITLRNNMQVGMSFMDENGLISFINKDKLLNPTNYGVEFGDSLSTSLLTPFTVGAESFIWSAENVGPYHSLSGMDYSLITLGSQAAGAALYNYSNLTFDTWPYGTAVSYTEQSTLKYYIK